MIEGNKELNKMIRCSKNIFSVMVTEDNWTLIVIGDKGDKIKIDKSKFILKGSVGLFVVEEIRLKALDFLKTIEPRDEDKDDVALQIAFGMAVERLEQALPNILAEI